jgi:hypothetical protein
MIEPATRLDISDCIFRTTDRDMGKAPRLECRQLPSVDRAKLSISTRNHGLPFSEPAPEGHRRRVPASGTNFPGLRAATASAGRKQNRSVQSAGPHRASLNESFQTAEPRVARRHHLRHWGSWASSARAPSPRQWHTKCRVRISSDGELPQGTVRARSGTRAAANAG